MTETEIPAPEAQDAKIVQFPGAITPPEPPTEPVKLRNLLVEGLNPECPPPAVTGMVGPLLQEIKTAILRSQDPKLNFAKKIGLQAIAWRVALGTFCRIADAIAELEDATRHTLVQAHGKYLQIVQGKDQKIRKDFDNKLDQYTTAIQRLQERFNRLEGEHARLESAYLCTFYRLCEQSAFFKSDPSLSTDVKEEVFLTSFDAYQEEAIRIYAKREGWERRPGSFRNNLLVGQPTITIFNLEELQVESSTS